MQYLAGADVWRDVIVLAGDKSAAAKGVNRPDDPTRSLLPAFQSCVAAVLLIFIHIAADVSVGC